jgi:SAM-dependent methyltransferase
LPALLDRYWERDRLIEDSQDAATVWQRRVAISEAGAERSYKAFAPFYSGPPGRFLDIACGLGETVRKFRDCGWEAEGIDVDASTKPFHEKRKLRTRIGRFEEEPIIDQYEMIHIAHAIYFITDTMAFLRRVRAQLTDNGLFAVVISDFLAAHAQAAPGYIHTIYPCRDSMRYALALAGLETVMTRTIGGDIYLAARPAAPQLPRVNSHWIYWQYRTKSLRFATFGRPYLAVRWLAKKLRDRVSSCHQTGRAV